ncbi:hypothetical protein [Streptomyces sp. NPDC001480]|uniref:hypothetical protein n=1 Tax=Streptomyces sp. NPDC001480 TaxID=3364577 RepID=UPI0036C754E5
MPQFVLRVDKPRNAGTGGNMADFWTIITALSAVAGNIVAVWVAIASLKRADAALTQAQEIAERQLEAQDDFDGAAACIAWREQLIALHDRGLSPEQIRRIMLLEPGGEGYEPGMGRIDAILRDIPRQRPT